MRILLFLAALAATNLSAAPIVGIAAKVGNEIVTSGDVDNALLVLEQAMSPAERNSVEGQKKLAEARQRVLDRMIDQKLVGLAAKDGPPGFKEAQEKGQAGNNPYLPDGTEVESEMEKLFDQARQRAGNQEAFEAALGAERMSIQEFRNKLRETVRDQMTYSRMAKYKEREFQTSLRVTDEEAKEYYDKNLSRFAVGDQVKLRHILLGKDGEAKAKALMDQLKKTKDQKAAFIAAARKDSTDEPTRDQGGLLGWIEKGQSWPELEHAAFGAADNSLVGPVKSDAGWHLLLIEGRQSGKQKSFDEVKASARNMVYQEKNQHRLEEWVAELRRKYYVEKK